MIQFIVVFTLCMLVGYFASSASGRKARAAYWEGVADHWEREYWEQNKNHEATKRALRLIAREKDRENADFEKQLSKLNTEHNDLLDAIGVAYNTARSNRITRNLSRNFFKKGSPKMNETESSQGQDGGSGGDVIVKVAGVGVEVVEPPPYVVGARRLIHDVPGVPEVYLVPGEIGRGGAPVSYTFETLRGNRTLQFHSGPIDKGFDGWTNEALTAILIDRFEGFQSGEFPCETNLRALEGLRIVQQAMADRTADRRARGVEGKIEK